MYAYTNGFMSGCIYVCLCLCMWTTKIEDPKIGPNFGGLKRLLPEPALKVNSKCNIFVA